MIPQFASTYVELAKTSEASEVLYLWTAVAGTAVMLGRNVYLPFGSGRIHANLYLQYVGDPGTRKSSAIKDGKRLLKAAGYVYWCGDKVTLQKLMCDLAGVDENGDNAQAMQGKTPADFRLDSVTLDGLGFKALAARAETVELFICQDEFSDFIGVGNFPMIATFSNWWDISEPYEYRIRTGASLLIPTPTINILGGTTPGQFNSIFPTSAADQGFLSRVILVSAAATGKKFHHPVAPDERVTKEVVEHFKKIRQLKGEIKILPEADKLLKDIYHSWRPLEDARFAFYSTRRHTQLLKLCINAAAMRLTPVVSKADVIFANTLLVYTERHMPDALGAFGKEDNSDVSNRIVDMLSRAHAPMSIAEIYPSVQRDLLWPDFIKLLQSMNQGSMIQGIGGKYLAKKAPIQRETDTHVEWELLRGIAPDLNF